MNIVSDLKLKYTIKGKKLNIKLKTKDYFIIQYDNSIELYISRNKKGNQAIFNICKNEDEKIDKSSIYYWFHLQSTSKTCVNTILYLNINNLYSNLYEAMKWIHNNIYDSLPETIYCNLKDVKYDLSSVIKLNYKNETFCNTINW